uniref:Parvovirus non-structural protein 1 helicase domain-containing protein n=1 Tax=Anopheles atroparvus TaxID=41427 RepID=A0AAG5D5Z7_ANOAO
MLKRAKEAAAAKGGPRGLLLWILYQFFDVHVDKDLKYEGEIGAEHWTKVANFIKELCQWFNGEADRRYTYCLIVQTKRGKTTFADVIMDLKINVGVKGNYNRNTSFPLNMCANKSMYYWNEPDIEPGALEEIKKIAGGDKHSVAIKHKHNRTQKQVQLLMTANKVAFPHA